MNIEELAFKNYYELINIQKIDLLLIIEFLQKDRKEWINQFTQTHNISVDIQKENQELKKKLEECKDKINWYENFEVNKTIDKLRLKHNVQQKEFIKWLEDEIQQQETLIAENQEKSYFLIYEDEKKGLELSSQKAYIRRIIIEEVLQKYRSIIGVLDDKTD